MFVETRLKVPAAMLLLGWMLLPIPAGSASRKPPHGDAGGVLNELSIASFGAGKSIQAISTDSSGDIFVAGTTTTPDLPVRNAFQPSFAESRILRSTDLGVTWTRVGNPPQDVTVVVPDPVDAQTLFANGQTGIYRSKDAGATWQVVYQFPSGIAFTGELVVDPGNHLRVAALVPLSGGLIRSFDGGQTWIPGNSSCSSSNCGNHLLVDPGGSGALLLSGFGLSLSRDWGATFQPLRPPGISSVGTAAFDPSHPGWIYSDSQAGVMGTLALSTDYGATWTIKASPPTVFSGIQHLVVDPDQPATLLAGTADGLYKSVDGASSWTRQSSPGGPSPLNGNAPFAILSHRCAPSGGLFGIVSGPGTFSVAFSPDYGISFGTPKLSKILSVTTGPGCSAYVTRQSSSDAFVAKLAPDGSVLWSTFLGGSDQDAPVAMAVDGRGSVYVTGTTSSSDFPSTVPRIGVAGQTAVFVTKFSPQGSLEYSTLVGGEATNAAVAIALDDSQNVYVAGRTNSVSFPLTAGVVGTKLDPSSYTGFVVKLSPTGTLAYSTYLGEYYTFASAILVDKDEQVVVAGTGSIPGTVASPGAIPEFVMRLDRTASRVVSSTYLEGTSGGGFGPTALAFDSLGNLLVSGGTSGTAFPTTPGAYVAPQSAAGCAGIQNSGFGYGDVYLTKLAAADWKPIFSALLRAPCGIQPGAISVDNTGATYLALDTGAGLPLHNPLVAGPPCQGNTSAIAKISADGSTLEFATYLDNCGVPSLAVSQDGSIYAGVSPNYLTHSVASGVLHLPKPVAPAISLDSIANAFSGDSSAVVAGGLYTLSGSGFQPQSIRLGLNPAQDLPPQLGGIQVKFDGVAAAIDQTGPGMVIAALPEQLPSSERRGRTPGFTKVQLFFNGVSSNPVWMPVSTSLPGLLTRDFPALLPHADFTDGTVYNADGTPNDADHPAAAGSTITVFATGLGALSPPDPPGSIARSLKAVTVTPVYDSWQAFSPGHVNVPVPVYTVPGFLSSLLQIRIHVPDTLQNLGGTTLSSGVQRAPLWLKFQVAGSSNIPPASNGIGVYLK